MTSTLSPLLVSITPNTNAPIYGATAAFLDRFIYRSEAQRAMHRLFNRVCMTPTKQP